MYFVNNNTKTRNAEVRNTDLFDVYLLNLLVTVGMFTILIFRAWLELKNYRMMWQELEWRRTYQTMGRLLKAEKDMFSKVEGGEELYQMLLEVFKVNEDKKA
jgi:hypothetical protein